jgi:hypothetical protein
LPSFDERSTSSSQNEVATSCNNSDCSKAPRQQENPTPFEAVQPPSVYSGNQTLSNLVLIFSQDELCSYVDARIAGLARKSRDWIVRAAQMLWRISRGEISQTSMAQLRSTILTHYTSAWSHGKMLNFANAFLKYLTKVRLDARYSAFEIFLEMPKLLKERKVITARIVTKADITNVLTHIKRAEQAGSIDNTRARQYTAFVVFGAYTGQRSMATAANLTVGQFRQALEDNKPVLLVTAKQDKIRMEHYVPLHPCVVKAVSPLLDERKDAELMFQHGSLWMWIKRQNISMSRFSGHFVLSDLRKFTEQCGDIIQWDQSNRAYIMTHGVSGIDWKHYKHPLPENVYDVYMKCWEEVRFDV